LPVEEAAAAAAAAALPDAAAAAAAAELASICLPGCPAQIKKRRRRRPSTEHNLAEHADMEGTGDRRSCNVAHMQAAYKRERQGVVTPSRRFEMESQKRDIPCDSTRALRAVN